MSAEIVQPLIEPDTAQMLGHLEHLFGGYLDGCHEGKVELAWTDGRDGKLRHAAIFGTDELDALVERAVQANRLGVDDAERPWLIRLDDAKNNMSPPAENAIWFKRKGVLLPNGLPPLGVDPDNVGVVEPWAPPDVKAPISRHTCNRILEDIDLRWKAGNPYSASHQARGRHVVPRMVKEHGVPKASAEDLLNSWFANGVISDEVFDKHRKATGLRVLRFIND